MSSRVALPRLVSGPGRTLYWVVVLALIIAVMVMASPSASWAQAVTGTLLGSVTDSQGAGVPGATVTATETQTNISRTAVTNSSGHYIFTNVKNGIYRVAADLSGFKRVARDGVPVKVNSTVRIDFTLEVGTMSESVEVVQTTPLLQTD